MENSALAELPAHDRLLVLLKSRGPSHTAALASALAITGEAARQQLVRLQQDGLVEASSEIRGRGRPVQVWKLTPLANRRFPDSHAELATQLIRNIRATLGEPALDRLIEARAEELLAGYRLALKGANSLKTRIHALAALRNAEGYMTECRSDKSGYLFIQNHCPICAVSGACLKFCRSEESLFSKLLGPGVRVDREEHIANGSRRCVYRVRLATNADKTAIL